MMKTTNKKVIGRKPQAEQAQIQTPLSPVHFEFDDPAARKVSIAGSFNDWRPEAGEMAAMGSGHFVKDIDLAPGTYEYRLVVDGKWITDPKCPRTAPNPFGEANSLLVVPESTALKPRKQTRSRA